MRYLLAFTLKMGAGHKVCLCFGCKLICVVINAVSGGFYCWLVCCLKEKDKQVVEYGKKDLLITCCVGTVLNSDINNNLRQKQDGI